MGIHLWKGSFKESTIITPVLSWRVGSRVSEIISTDSRLSVGKHELTLGEISALSYFVLQYDKVENEKPEYWTALAISGHSEEPIYAGLEGGIITVTGGPCSDDVMQLITAAATGIEARAPWNSDVEFGITEIEGAKAYLAGWSSASDPYRNKCSEKGSKWLSGWEAARCYTESLL